MPAKTIYDPAEHQHIVGMTFVKQEHRPILVIGKKQFSRLDLCQLGATHIPAAVNLQRIVVAKDIRSMEQLAAEASDIGNHVGYGVTAYSTLLAVLNAEGFDVEAVHGEKRSFHSIKRAFNKREGINGNGHHAKPRKRSRRRK